MFSSLSSRAVQAAKVIPALGLIAASESAVAEYALNMPQGVTEISQEVYDLHMTIFYVCCVIGVIVFGAMFYSIFAHRKSRGAEAASFHHSTAVEIVWTIIPFVVLIGMAVPAASTLIKMENTRGADMSIKITGYQWKWGYEYIGEGVSYYSTLAQPDNYARQIECDEDQYRSDEEIAKYIVDAPADSYNKYVPAPKLVKFPEGQTDICIKPSQVDNYLLNVDNPVVVPTGKKIRLMLTAADVIHAWWMKDFAVKKDAIPGFINETWMKIDEPGVYRGKCAELCGRDHGFMPVVVIAKTPEDYELWLAEEKARQAK